MSPRMRIFSEMDDSFSTSSSVSDAQSDGRSFLSSRPQKRRKTNKNTRFARMADTMKAMSSRHAAPSSHQRGSSNTSSATNSFRPFSREDGARLGQDFSLIKMKNLDSSGTVYEETTSDISRQRQPLPSWLQNTISELASHHPLRVILPQESEAELKDKLNVFDDMQSSDATYEETHTFAFTVPPLPSSSPASLKAVHGFAQLYPAKSDANFQPLSNSPLLENAVLERCANTPDTHNTPFSAPGPIYNSVTQKGQILQDDRIISDYNRFTDSSVTFSLPPRVPLSNTLEHADDLPTINQPPSFESYYEDGPFEFEMSTAPQPPICVYFDSPLEDPTSSDPMEPEEYELFKPDPEQLDFCWMPFDRKSIGRHETTRPQVDLLDVKADARREVLAGVGLEDDSMYASFSDEHGTETLGEAEFQQLASHNFFTSENFVPTLRSIGGKPSTSNRRVVLTSPGMFVGRREDSQQREDEGDDILEEALDVVQKRPDFSSMIEQPLTPIRKPVPAPFPKLPDGFGQKFETPTGKETLSQRSNDRIQSWSQR